MSGVVGRGSSAIAGQRTLPGRPARLRLDLLEPTIRQLLAPTSATTLPVRCNLTQSWSLPDSCHTIGIECRVNADNGQTFSLCLRDQHAIEGITMLSWKRQSTDCDCV